MLATDIIYLYLFKLFYFYFFNTDLLDFKDKTFKIIYTECTVRFSSKLMALESVEHYSLRQTLNITESIEYLLAALNYMASVL